ncbi:hypothetical protein TKK_0013907 [Trichogramma kaykai]
MSDRESDTAEEFENIIPQNVMDAANAAISDSLPDKSRKNCLCESLSRGRSSVERLSGKDVSDIPGVKISPVTASRSSSVPVIGVRDLLFSTYQQGTKLFKGQLAWPQDSSEMSLDKLDSGLSQTTEEGST